MCNDHSIMGLNMRSSSAKKVANRKVVQKQQVRRNSTKEQLNTIKHQRQNNLKNPISIGPALREARERAGLSVRELARRVHVSASLISQIEYEQSRPSVDTLFAIASELKIPLNDLFKNKKRRAQTDHLKLVAPLDVITRSINRNTIRLKTGVRWECLTPTPDSEVEFLYLVYDVGGASCEEGTVFRHGGKEYGYVISGRLGVQIGFEKYELGPGDSMSFDAQVPHRFWTIGDEPAVAILAILRRHSDSRRATRPKATSRK